MIKTLHIFYLFTNYNEINRLFYFKLKVEPHPTSYAYTTQERSLSDVHPLMKIRLKEIVSKCPIIKSVWPKFKRKTATTNVNWESILNTLNPWDKSHLGDSKISVGSFKMYCQLFLVMPLHYKLQAIIQ